MASTAVSKAGCHTQAFCSPDFFIGDNVIATATVATVSDFLMRGLFSSSQR